MRVAILVLFVAGLFLALLVLRASGDRGGFVVWVEGDVPATWLVSITSTGQTVNYVPPSRDTRRALGTGDSTGTIRIYNADCQLLDQATFGPDDSLVQIRPAGTLAVTTYGWLAQPPSNTLLLTRTDASCPGG
jgi:hypothetical protein